MWQRTLFHSSERCVAKPLPYISIYAVALKLFPDGCSSVTIGKIRLRLFFHSWYSYNTEISLNFFQFFKSEIRPKHQVLFYFLQHFSSSDIEYFIFAQFELKFFLMKFSRFSVGKLDLISNMRQVKFSFGFQNFRATRLKNCHNASVPTIQQFEQNRQ